MELRSSPFELLQMLLECTVDSRIDVAWCDSSVESQRAPDRRTLPGQNLRQDSISSHRRLQQRRNNNALGFPLALSTDDGFGLTSALSAKAENERTRTFG